MRETQRRESRTQRIIQATPPCDGEYPAVVDSPVTVAVTAVLAVLFVFSSSIKLLGVARSVAIRDHLGISPQLWKAIGGLELAGVVGVLAGLAWPPIGVAAAIGLALLSVGAVASHLRAQDGAADIAPAVVAIVLAVVTAVLQAG